jgi:predicted ATPase with chaperone activity
MDRDQEFQDGDEPEVPSTGAMEDVAPGSEAVGRGFSVGSDDELGGNGADGPDETVGGIAAPQFFKRPAVALGEPEENENDDEEDSDLPKPPKSLTDVGLSKAFLTDLALKIIHFSGTISAGQLTRRLGLNHSVVQRLLTALADDRLVEVLSQSDLYTGNYRYRMSERGVRRVAEALERSRYAGAAPVTAEQYTETIHRWQAVRQEPSRARIKELLNELVLASEVSDAVARALYSGKTAMLFGESGNGKSIILESFARNQEGVALVPYAIYAYGQVVRVFDQSIHEPVEDVDSRNITKDDMSMDRRWVQVRRPGVVLGAELGAESLDLAYDPQSRFYQAPPHLKAQGGVLVIDDFGRQKISARDLLTRLMIPLERGWDTLSLATGEKLQLPFSIQILFGTNLKVREMADGALLRRILYKVRVPGPTREDFAEIMRRLCHQKRVLVKDGALDHAVEQVYGQAGQAPRASHVRDLLDIIIEGSRFDGREPELDKESFDKAFQTFTAREDDEELLD